VHDYIPYGHQFIDDNDIKSVVDVLRSDWLTQGPTVELFERALAHFFGARYAVTLSSGTAALHASYFAAGLQASDEIMTSPITYISTANAARFLGCRIKFIDIEPETANIDASLIDEQVAVNTRAIVPVDFAGQPADLREIKSISREHNLIVIEDACHAIGAEYQGAKVGNVSDLTIFSFHPVKNMTTGEGGAVLTNNRDFYERLLIFRNNGVTRSEEINETYGPWYYEVGHLGLNYRLTDLQCALGLSQLRKLDSFIRRRREIVSHYDQAFRGVDEVEPLVEKRDRLAAWHIYVIKLNQKRTANARKEVFLKLRRAGIGVQVHYIPVYWQPYYQKLGYAKGLCTVAEAYYESAITLPVFPSMTDEQVEKVVEEVQRALRIVK
jgi:perosamine synthetase